LKLPRFEKKLRVALDWTMDLSSRKILSNISTSVHRCLRTRQRTIFQTDNPVILFQNIIEVLHRSMPAILFQSLLGF